MPKNHRKYICDDCKHEQFEVFLIRNRAKRPQCPRCGSYWYELKTKASKDDAADLLSVKQQVDRSADSTFSAVPKRSRDRLDRI